MIAQNWDDGILDLLPIIFAFVVAAGGQANAVQGVSHAWQTAMNSITTKLRIRFGSRTPHPIAALPARFRRLTDLDIGESNFKPSHFPGLPGNDTLQRLSLGEHYTLTPASAHPFTVLSSGRRLPTGSCLAVTLVASGLQGLSRFSALSALYLGGCINLTDEGVAYLKGLPLTSLDLSRAAKLTDLALSFLEGMPLTSLSISGCRKITAVGISYLKGMPIATLDLSKIFSLADAALPHLRGMPLASLDLTHCSQLTPTGLQHLLELPLTSLSLGYCTRMNEMAVRLIARLTEGPLARLSLVCCYELKGPSLPPLKQLSESLTDLDLSK